METKHIVLCLQALANSYGFAVAAEELEVTIAKGGEPVERMLPRVLKTLGLHGELWQGTSENVAELKTPAIVKLSGNPCALVMQVGKTEVMLVDPAERRSFSMTHAEFF